MSFAQSQLRCRLPDGQIAAAAVLLKVHHCLAHIAALGAGLHAGKRLWLRCGLCGDALLQRQNGVFQIAVMKRLQQKVHRAQTDGRLRVGERIVGGQNDDIRAAACFAQPPHHLQPVHLRHFEIRDDKRRLAVLRDGKGLFAVGGFADHDAVQCRPVYCHDDAPADHFLILYNHYPHHTPGPPFAGRRARIQAPPPSGFSRRRPNASP